MKSASSDGRQMMFERRCNGEAWLDRQRRSPPIASGRHPAAAGRPLQGRFRRSLRRAAPDPTSPGLRLQSSAPGPFVWAAACRDAEKRSFPVPRDPLRKGGRCRGRAKKWPGGVPAQPWSQGKRWLLLSAIPNRPMPAIPGGDHGRQVCRQRDHPASGAALEANIAMTPTA